jgi:hypothetical protein
MQSSVSMRPSAGQLTTRQAAAQPSRLPLRRLLASRQQQQQPAAAAPSRAFVATQAAADRDVQAAASTSSASEWLLRAATAASAGQEAAATPSTSTSSMGLTATAALLLTAASAAAPGAASAAADVVGSNPFEGVQANSLYVTLALFLMSVPGIWSQVKRAPKSKIKRVTFQVPGPKFAAFAAAEAPEALEGQPARELDDTARMVFRHFKRYNYEVASAGEVITFAGVYAADRGQAAAVTLYTFFGLGSIALVLATLWPSVGGAWYLLTAASPLAAVYYFRNGERREEVRVKMVASDDERTADVVVEGDADEIERMAKELGFVEKGKVRVKGILEQQQQAQA